MLRACEFMLKVRGYKVWGQVSGVRRCQARAQCGVWTPHYANSGHVGQLIQPQGHPQTSPLSHPATTSIHWLLLLQSGKVWILTNMVDSHFQNQNLAKTFLNGYYAHQLAIWRINFFFSWFDHFHLKISSTTCHLWSVTVWHIKTLIKWPCMSGRQNRIWKVVVMWGVRLGHYRLELQTIHWFSQSRRWPLL